MMRKNILYIAVLLMILILCSAPLTAQSPVPDGAVVDKIHGGYQFVEGPVWVEPGYLLFSDIDGNTVYKWSEEGGSEVFLSPSGKSNGLALDLEGRLLLAQHGNRRIARIEADGTEVGLVSQYQGKKLNSPNDMTVKSNGNIYFTDPPYGINSSQEELKFYGIYCLLPDGSLHLLDKTLNRPNGIVFSPDETKLYVNDSQALKIYVWDVVDDTTITNKKLFYSMTGSGAADGMKVDTNGNLYSTGPTGVWIFTPEKKLLDKIAVPGQTTNLNWGDADRQMLYITAGNSVYRIHLNATGMQTGITRNEQPSLPVNVELFDNYPNPFNPSTTISFRLYKSEHIIVQILNVQGRLVRTLAREYFSEGTHNLLWNACDENGTSVASGIYHCRIITNNGLYSKKMLLLK